MADTQRDADSPARRLLVWLALLLATVLWIAAVWLGFYRPDLIAPFGPEARLAVLAIAWALPLLLTVSGWLTLRRARRALAEARSLFAETERLARRLRAVDAAPKRSEPAGDGPTPKPAASTPPTAAATTTDQPVASPARDPISASRATLWAALDFPRSEADEAGFDALRSALAGDPKLAAVIRRAQLVLSLLAQEGIKPDAVQSRPAPELWRLYAAGTRGNAIAALGEVGDRDLLSLTVGRMRRDPAFRSAAHRFVAAFDTWLLTFLPEADDADLARLANSRCGRAFRLLGRATGSFGHLS